MRFALVLVSVAACAAPVPSATSTSTSTSTPTATPTAKSSPSLSSSSCAAGEALVQARYEPLCVTLCASTPDCKGNGPCEDATDTDGQAIKICEATGDPPKKKP
jgi:hypothetical protein